MIYTFFWFGIIFGFLAGLCAFLITYIEYQKHQFRGRQLFVESARAGIFAWAVFAGIGLLIGYLLKFI